MSTSAAERMQQTRDRRRAKLMLVTVECADDWPVLLCEGDFLAWQDIENPKAISAAMSKMLEELRATGERDGRW